MSKENMTTYLNDHLTGSAGALDLVQHLSDLHSDDQETKFYQQLHCEISEDQKVLKDLIHRLGEEETSLGQVAGQIAEKFSRLKLTLTKVEGNDLGLFESLEVLVLGVNGKCLLWKAILALNNPYPEWSDINFKKLEQQAQEQRDRVEKKRMEAGSKAL